MGITERIREREDGQMSEAMPQMPDTEPETPETRPDSTSSVGDAKERLVGEAKQRTSEVREQARAKLRDQLDQRSTEIGQQLGSMGSAVGEAARKLREDGNAPAADLTERAAEKVGRFASYLEHADGDRMLRDVEDVARRQPMLVAAGGLVLGFVGSRFLKASSSRRFHSPESQHPSDGRYFTGTADDSWGGPIAERPADVVAARPGMDGV
jgi:hypothetical protein